MSRPSLIAGGVAVNPATAAALFLRYTAAPTRARCVRRGCAVAAAAARARHWWAHGAVRQNCQLRRNSAARRARGAAPPPRRLRRLPSAPACYSSRQGQGCAPAGPRFGAGCLGADPLSWRAPQAPVLPRSMSAPSGSKRAASGAAEGGGAHAKRRSAAVAPLALAGSMARPLRVASAGVAALVSSLRAPATLRAPASVSGASARVLAGRARAPVAVRAAASPVPARHAALPAAGAPSGEPMETDAEDGAAACSVKHVKVNGVDGAAAR